MDDVASTGETLAAAARLASGRGAAAVDVAVSHALLGVDARDRLQQAGIGRIVSTDSCRHPAEAAPLAALIAPAVRDELVPGNSSR